MPQPSNSSEFEKNFSNMSFAVLRDKAPALLDYLIGFQLLDKNDDDNRAVGVFGCKLGGSGNDAELVYVPVFFISGELKWVGMYLKNQGLFVPMEEPWVMYCL